MKIISLHPGFSDRTPFRLSNSSRVPEHSGCYVLANILDDVIYIGQSVNLFRRMQQHLDTPRMTGRTSAGLPVWFYWRLWPVDEIESQEAQLIFNFKAAEGQLPPLNRSGP